MRVSYSFAVRDQNRLVYQRTRTSSPAAVRTARPDAAMVRAFSVVARRRHRLFDGFTPYRNNAGQVHSLRNLHCAPMSR